MYSIEKVFKIFLYPSFPCPQKTTLLHVGWENIYIFFIPFSLDALPRVTCPNHPDAILVEDYRAGDMICPECGLVVGE